MQGHVTRTGSCSFRCSAGHFTPQSTRRHSGQKLQWTLTHIVSQVRMTWAIWETSYASTWGNLPLPGIRQRSPEWSHNPHVAVKKCLMHEDVGVSERMKVMGDYMREKRRYQSQSCCNILIHDLPVKPGETSRGFQTLDSRGNSDSRMSFQTKWIRYSRVIQCGNPSWPLHM